MAKSGKRSTHRLGAVLGSVAFVGSLLTVAAPAAHAANPLDGFTCESGGYRIFTPYTYASDRMVLGWSHASWDNGSIVQEPWQDAAHQQWTLCGENNPTRTDGKYYKLMDHARHWCLGIDQAMTDDGNWLIDEPCNYSQSEIFFIQPVPGTNLKAIMAKHSNRWLSVDGSNSGSHVTQGSFKADLFELHKVW
ncbi:RICIN domain-containing protein [Kitasatospora sp. NPDC058046]|uniref:RICIN domain-containing protein n=1 Tax=Kitasatospora sp. NPDC058046 TaxID=3346312 RepID=UPI0036DD7A59